MIISIKKYSFEILCLLIALSLWGGSILIWSVLPIYPDEFAYHIYASRFSIDGATRTHLMPLCHGASGVHLPPVLYPIAFILSAMSSIDQLWQIRALGILFTLLTTAIVALALRHQVQQGACTSQAACAVIMLFACLMSIGTTPVILVFLRGEYLLFVLVALVIFGISSLEKFNHSYRRGLSCLIALMFLLAWYIHPKVIYFLPAVLLCLLILLRGMRLTPIIISGYLIFAIPALFQMNSQLFLQCPAYPAVEQANGSMNISLLDLFSNPQKFFTEFVENNQMPHWFWWLGQFGFKDDYLLYYNVNIRYYASILAAGYNELPFIAVIANYGGLVLRALMSMIVVVVLLCLPLIASSTIAPFVKRRLTSQQRGIIMVIWLLILGNTVHFLLNRSQYYYDGPIWTYVFLLALLSPLSWLLSRITIQKPLYKWGLGIGLFLVVVAGFLNLTASYALIHRPIVAGKGQMGVPIVDRDDRRHDQQILQAAAQCGLNVNTPRLLTDFTTQQTLRHSRHIMGLEWMAAGVCYIKGCNEFLIIGENTRNLDHIYWDKLRWIGAKAGAAGLVVSRQSVPPNIIQSEQGRLFCQIDEPSYCCEKF